MKFRALAFIFCCLAGGVILLGQAGCSSAPAPNTASVQPAASPSATVDQTTAMTAASPGTVTSPAAGSSLAQATPAPATAAKPPAETPKSGAGNVAPPAAKPTPEPTPKPPQTYTMASGTAISVFTERDLSTKTATSGQEFTGSLARDIVSGDWVIAKKGARVEGVVVNSDPGGKVKGRASISVRLKSLTLADGRTVSLSTSTYAKEAKSTKKKDAAKIGIGAGIGAAIGAIAGGGKGAAIGAGAGGAGGTGLVLATRGDPAVIPAESQLTFRLSAPVKITRR